MTEMMADNEDTAKIMRRNLTKLYGTAHHAEKVNRNTWRKIWAGCKRKTSANNKKSPEDLIYLLVNEIVRIYGISEIMTILLKLQSSNQWKFYFKVISLDLADSAPLNWILSTISIFVVKYWRMYQHEDLLQEKKKKSSQAYCWKHNYFNTSFNICIFIWHALKSSNGF